jgi:predicted nuclease of predicted toxin-antitoxin system
MKFLVDAHLPPGLCGLLQAAGVSPAAKTFALSSLVWHYIVTVKTIFAKL